MVVRPQTLISLHFFIRKFHIALDHLIFDVLIHYLLLFIFVKFPGNAEESAGL